MMSGGGCQPPITIEEETPAAKQGVLSGDRFYVWMISRPIRGVM